MSPSGLFPPMKDPACPFLFESMEPKDASGHLVSTLPAAAHPSPCHIPSDSCHLQVLHRQMCTPTISTGCSVLSPASVMSMCSCSLLFDSCCTLRPELPLGNGKALHQVLCENPLNPTRALRKCSCQTPGHTAATPLQQKRHF